MSEAMKIEVMVIKAEETCNKEGRRLVKMIWLSVTLFHARMR